jgi:DNA-binding transcriptional MerR regulator
MTVPSSPPDLAQPRLVKMADLARRSGVPAATIKHYVREGLLPEPAVRTSRNMAYYDEGLVPRIQAIKELQRTRFLPLKIIKDALDRAGDDAAGGAQSGEQVARAIERVLARQSPVEQRTRAELLAAGMPAEQLDWLRGLGLVTPVVPGEGERYEGDDLALLQTLGAARRAGLRPDMLPHTILAPYLQAIQALVRLELEMFRAGVLPRAEGDVAALTEVATELSERLVVLIRRKMLVPMLRELVSSPAPPRAGAPRAGAARARATNASSPRGPIRSPAPVEPRGPREARSRKRQP